MKKKKYDESSIEWYKGLSGVRNQPSLYIGQLGNHAVFHMLREAVENSIDESVDGNNNYVGIKVEGVKTPQTFTIVDNGRGVPVGIHKKSKMSTLTTILTKLHAGGKFNNKSYSTSRGCFIGNTRIKLLDGTNTTIKSLYKKFKKT